MNQIATNQAKQAIFLKDYQVTDFIIKTINLEFKILSNKVLVQSTLEIQKREKGKEQDLQLNGEDLKTLTVKLNNETLTLGKDYNITNNLLTIAKAPDIFTLFTEVEIDPFNNTKLMGIYKTKSCLASQCEPEGFRRITWFLDRPDVLPIWTVSICANTKDYKVLLSNGNLLEKKQEGALTTCKFHDPRPKPSYLFAFVAGNLDVCSGSFTTMSGRKVALNVFVEQGKKVQAEFALASLQKAMKWDEQRFNLEYEFEVFSIVAVSDFNFGAMENTSLNIFNEAYILADPKLATDDDYFNVESVVAHEYFHNFTGNKITCRDWFQLTLKEGLTVYRDNIFSEDLNNKDIVRINHVDKLRNFQFPEDKGALSHPIRPLSYIEMNNFYTTTVYEKGAEVIRMLATMLGTEKFKEGIKIYFDNFSGQAVTCEDFVWAMEQASGQDFTKFKNWYLQSGTPVVNVKHNYDSKSFVLNLTIQQKNYPTADQAEKGNLTLPFKVALFNESGELLTTKVNNTESQEHLIILEDAECTVSFYDVKEKPTVSFNRNFSAPVIVKYQQPDNELINLMQNDTDGFVAYESSMQYLKKHILKLIQKIQSSEDTNIEEVQRTLLPFTEILDNYKNNMYLCAMLLRFPTITSFEEDFPKDFPLEAIDEALKTFVKAMALQFENKFLEIFNSIKDNESEYTEADSSIRALKNKTLAFLIKTEKPEYLTLCLDYYQNTKSMTKKIATLVACKDYINAKEHKEIFESFYEEFKEYPLVLNKWFGIQAGIAHEGIISNIKKLTKLNTFSYKNPNKVRYLFSGFANNYLYFHNVDGSGYKFLAETIIKIDKINPSVAASLAKIFAKIKVHTQARQDIVKVLIADMLKQEDISKGLYEILFKINADITK